MLAFGALLLAMPLVKPTPRNISGLAHSARWSPVGADATHSRSVVGRARHDPGQMIAPVAT
jgi:hypothetical protein